MTDSQNSRMKKQHVFKCFSLEFLKDKKSHLVKIKLLWKPEYRVLVMWLLVAF